MAKVLQVFEKCSFLGHASDWVACYEHPTSWWCESRYHSTIDQSTIEPAGCRSSLGQLSIAHNYTEAPCSERIAAWRKGKHDLAVTGPASACFGTLRGKSRVIVVNRRKCSESRREASIAVVCQERVLSYNA
ncbi:hypothetical protein KGM_213817 [Danaus plexippus plexippus]|uniref:Uncharacterized protein n=1 Tax=Danaus plexippus plexippus TaxID=278856 RepID=A0A212FNJ8_DANPL|nr:hypothetical protein KGM_213817 [Danaus plexippus plexippus]